MLGIDTNVLVRFVVRNDESQYEKVRRLIRRQLQACEPVFVSQLVMLETEWVLQRLGCMSTASFDAKALKLPGFTAVLDRPLS